MRKRNDGLKLLIFYFVWTTLIPLHIFDEVLPSSLFLSLFIDKGAIKIFITSQGNFHGVC